VSRTLWIGRTVTRVTDRTCERVSAGHTCEFQVGQQVHTADVSKPYWWQLQQICGQKIFGYVAEVWFAVFGFQRTRLSSVFGEFVSVKRAGFSLRKILNLTKLQNKILCLMCIDDSSLILIVSVAIIFSQ
jgi:hypothetical protein